MSKIVHSKLAVPLFFARFADSFNFLGLLKTTFRLCLFLPGMIKVLTLYPLEIS